MKIRRKWTIKETEELLDLYNKLPNDELIEHFNRSYVSIYKKARALGMYKNPEIEFINRSRAKSGANAYNWQGGRMKTSKGYVMVLNKEHPRATNNDGYIFEHILVMEKHLGRYLENDEVVHHINGIKDDNEIGNLKLMSHGEHTKLHHTGSKRSLKTRKKISKKARERHKNLKKGMVVNE